MNRFQIKVITDALEQPEKLTEWEYDFVSDLAEKETDDMGKSYELSEKQNAIINRIGQKLS